LGGHPQSSGIVAGGHAQQGVLGRRDVFHPDLPGGPRDDRDVGLRDRTGGERGVDGGQVA
jgi:hypothetical protein